MTSIIRFQLAIALLSPLLCHHGGAAAGDPFIFDLEQKVKDHVEGLAAQHKEVVSWWDMYGKHEHLSSRPKYKQYQVTVTTGPVKYGAARSTAARPSVVFTQWSHNEQPSAPQKLTVTRSKACTHTATWKTELGFSSSFSSKASGGIPVLASFKTHFQASLDLKTGRGEEHSETETLTVKQDIQIPPMKSVKVEWIVTDVVQDIPWTADVTAKGWFAVWFHRKVDGHWLWFYPITNVKDPLLKQGSDHSVHFTAKGLFTSVTVQESHLRVTEYDLQQYGGKPLSARTYTIPVHLKDENNRTKTL